MTVPGMERSATAPRLHCLVVVTHTKSHGTVSGNDPARSVKTRARSHLYWLLPPGGGPPLSCISRMLAAMQRKSVQIGDVVRERSGQVGEDQGQVAFVLAVAARRRAAALLHFPDVGGDAAKVGAAPAHNGQLAELFDRVLALARLDAAQNSGVEAADAVSHVFLPLGEEIRSEEHTS